jgi:cysteine desulfuration protein SufE
MTSLQPFLTNPMHAALIEEYSYFGSAEERLTWLLERSPVHPPLTDQYRTAEKRIPGCLSGLWLHTDSNDGRYTFRCASDSAVVQGVASILCDLLSDRPAAEIPACAPLLAAELRLDGLLTATRRRAINTVVAYCIHSAQAALPPPTDPA